MTAAHALEGGRAAGRLRVVAHAVLELVAVRQRGQGVEAQGGDEGAVVHPALRVPWGGRGQQVHRLRQGWVCVWVCVSV